jgi:beta-lactamase regulating signal transducer with metallopeptidase domain
MSIVGSVIILIYYAFRPLLKNRLPKTAQYYICITLLLVLLVPFSMFIKLPAVDVREAKIPVTVISNTVDRIMVSSTEIMDNWDAIIDSNGGYDESLEPLLDAVTPPVWWQEWSDMLPVIWWLGAIVCFGVIFCGYTYFAGKLKVSNITTDLKRKLPVYRNPNVQTPMLIGFFTPAIILPDVDYSAEELENILMHEFTHYRRRDLWIKWLSVIVGAIHWFNPIVWIFRGEVNRICELSCDEAVIRGLGTAEKQSYGETLIAVAAENRLPFGVMSTTMCAEKNALKERLGAIMKSRKFTKPAVVISAVLIVAIAAAAILIGAGSLKNPEDSWEISTLSGDVFESIRNSRITFTPDTYSLPHDFDSITLTLTNLDATEILHCGAHFQLEKRSGNDWKIVPFANGYGMFIDVLYGLKNGLSNTYTLKPEMFEACTPGNYRVVTEVFYGEYADRFSPYAEFIVSSGNGGTETPAPERGDGPSPNVPQEAQDVLNNYIKAVKTGDISAAIGYMYYDDERDYPQYDESPWFTDYNIVSYGYINDKLYSVTITVDANTLSQGWNFLGNINGEWKVITNAGQIPAEITENIDYNKYIYDDPNILNPNPGDTVQKYYEPTQWIEYYRDQEIVGNTALELDDFPGVVFNWTPEWITAVTEDGEKRLFGGMPVWDTFLTDLTQDGRPEICASVSFGSGIVDTRVCAYDYYEDTLYTLSDRFSYDYWLSMKGGSVYVRQTKYMADNMDFLGGGNLVIRDGELTGYNPDTRKYLDRTVPDASQTPEYQPTQSPQTGLKPLEELPADYDYSQALRDNLFIQTLGEVYNRNIVDNFYINALAGKAASMRTMLYTVEGDPIIKDYDFDGNIYTVTKDNTRDKFGRGEIKSKTYKYLIKINPANFNTMPNTVPEEYKYNEPAPIEYYLSNEKEIMKAGSNGYPEWLTDDIDSIPPPNPAAVE